MTITSSSRLTFSDVKVEEIAVEHGLDTSGHNGNEIEESLGVVSVHPVENVETPIESLSEQVMGSDGFCLSGLADHKQLW